MNTENAFCLKKERKYETEPMPLLSNQEDTIIIAIFDAVLQGKGK